MKIEEGKHYRNRRGEKVGPMKLRYLTPSGVDYPESGHDHDDGEESPFDLIEEWPEPMTASEIKTRMMEERDTIGDFIVDVLVGRELQILGKHGLLNEEDDGA